MADVFISYVEEDSEVAVALSEGLEAAGYTTWCYERHSVPGPSYLAQTRTAIEESRIFMLIISRASLGSFQIDKEVVRAHETGKRFLPVLRGVSHAEFHARQPEWGQAAGGATGIQIREGGVAEILPRIVRGFKMMRIEPADTSALAPGGEVREVTVMFADLSGVTAMSGKVPPEVLAQKINQYLAYIADQVEATGGYVDKFIGDAVMALWGALANDPAHAANAVRAAIAAVARVRQEHDAAAASGEIGFSVKIGLNSGPAVIGNLGTEKRHNYTALGEAVNLASELKNVAGLYACQVAVGPRTAELARDTFLFRELDTITVRGREAALEVFEPIAELATAVPEQHDRARRYAEALIHYRAMRLADAYALWDALAREESPHDKKGEPLPGPASRMAERARQFIAEPPPPDWNGVWIVTAK